MSMIQAGSGIIPPNTQNQNPLAQNAMRSFSSMMPEQLRETIQRFGPQSQQGQMAQRALMQKTMLPAQQPQAQPQPQQQQGITNQPVPTGQSGMNRGGIIPHRAGGGMMSLSEGDPSWSRQAEREATSGLLHSTVAGRTDQLQVTAPSGAYVVPADVVSGLGEGNTLSGARVIQEALQAGPWGTPVPKAGRGMGMPRPPSPNMLEQAKGGRTETKGKTVPILAAGGEYVIHPNDVAKIGKGDVKRGHAVLDRWVVNERKRIANEMLRLPPPAKS